MEDVKQTAVATEEKKVNVTESDTEKELQELLKIKLRKWR